MGKQTIVTGPLLLGKKAISKDAKDISGLDPPNKNGLFRKLFPGLNLFLTGTTTSIQRGKKVLAKNVARAYTRVSFREHTHAWG